MASTAPSSTWPTTTSPSVIAEPALRTDDDNHLDLLHRTGHPSPSVSERGRNAAARSFLSRTDTCRFCFTRHALHPQFLARLLSRSAQVSRRADAHLTDGVPQARPPGLP